VLFVFLRRRNNISLWYFTRFFDTNIYPNEKLILIGKQHKQNVYLSNLQVNFGINYVIYGCQ